MNNLAMIQNLANTITTGIEAEVNNLRDEANNRIGSREVARHFVNSNLQHMPVLINGTHMVVYTDDRNEKQAKTQDKNTSLWCVALLTTIETGHTSYAMLGSIFTQWAKDTLDKSWPRASSDKIAKMFINSMQSMHILHDKVEKIIYKDDKGNEQDSLVVKLSPKFLEFAATETEDLRAKSSMLCRPLQNMPNDWTSMVDGIGTNAGITLVTNNKVKTNIVAPDVLSAVNKLQHVQYMVSPHIVNAAYDLIDNQTVDKATEEDVRVYTELLQYEHSKVHFPVTMDTRGRMYYRGGLLTPQGTDFCKAAFQFAEFKELGDTGLDALYIHTANVLGYDRLSLTNRIDTIKSLIEKGTLAPISSHTDIADIFPKAKRFQGLVAVMEINRIHNTGATTSNLVCHQDGTCNGLQHMAAITHDRQTAVTVNCVAASPDELPKDIYGIIAKAAQRTSEGTVSDLIDRYGRDMAKNPVMITGYGAGLTTIVNNIAKHLQKKGADMSLAQHIGEAYAQAIQDNASAVTVLTTALKSRIKRAIENGHNDVQWTTPDGFMVDIEYKDNECNRVRAGVFNALLHDVFVAPLDEVKTVGALAPNFIHSLDATHLRMVINECDFDLVTVHDSIGSHPCDFFATGKAIRKCFVQVHEGNALDSLCKNLNVRTPNFRGDYSAVEALQSQYIFS